MSKSTLVALALASTVFAAQAQDAAAGEHKAAMCLGCNAISGYQSSFPEIYKVPMISGQSTKYIVASLTAYKKGERKHPTMRGIAASLSETDMADLGAYFEKHGMSSVKRVADTPAVAATSEVAALLTKGACASCHGANFSKPVDGTYPKIAGQHADYLYVALRSYKVTGNPQIGRSNAIMTGQMAQFKGDELKAIAKYLGSLPSELRSVPEPRFR